MNKYQKLPLTLECQLDTLRRRGLIIEDYDYACDQLSKIGYFRLANYWRPMEKDKKSHLFKPYSKFSNSVSLYYFDKELRVLLFSAIQSIEVSFRAKVMHEVAMVYGSFWIMNPLVFTNQRLAEIHLKKVRDEVKRSKEDFIIDHFERYDQPDIPPMWKTIEVVTFGTLSKLYQNLADVSVKKKIARSFGLPQHVFMESWIKPLAGLRNFIAHHSRVWNRKFPQMPKLPVKLQNSWICTDGVSASKLYAQLCCLVYLQNVIHPENDFVDQLKKLLSKYPNVDVQAMGFPTDWSSQPLWRTYG